MLSRTDTAGNQRKSRQPQAAIIWAMDSPVPSGVWGKHQPTLSLTVRVFNSRQRRGVQVGGRGLCVPLLVFLLALLAVLVLFSPGLTH